MKFNITSPQSKKEDKCPILPTVISKEQNLENEGADEKNKLSEAKKAEIIAAIEKSMDIGSNLPPKRTVRLVQKKRSTRQECQEMLSVIGYCVMFFLFGLYFGRFFTLRQHGVGRTSGWVTTPHSVTIVSGGTTLTLKDNEESVQIDVDGTMMVLKGNKAIFKGDSTSLKEKIGIMEKISSLADHRILSERIDSLERKHEELDEDIKEDEDAIDRIMDLEDFRDEFEEYPAPTTSVDNLVDIQYEKFKEEDTTATTTKDDIEI